MSFLLFRFLLLLLPSLLLLLLVLCTPASLSYYLRPLPCSFFILPPPFLLLLPQPAPIFPPKPLLSRKRSRDAAGAGLNGQRWALGCSYPLWQNTGRGKAEENRKLVNGGNILGFMASLVGDFHSFVLISGARRSWRGECRDGWGNPKGFWRQDERLCEPLPGAQQSLAGNLQVFLGPQA